ncbi:hypothetical protein B0T24DRAFT_513189, partial [Lasiosphaeria ovina]
FNRITASSSTDSSTTESAARSISTPLSAIDIQACENGILSPSSSKPPVNIKPIRARQADSRASFSPPKSVHEHFVDRINNAGNAATMAVEVGARLLKDHGDKDYTRAFSQAFTTFPKEVGFNNPLSTPQPGFVQGPRMAQFHLFLVHKHIDGAVLYSDDRLSVTLPHLAGGWGGRGKDMKRAALQAGYNGAAPVYARNKALSYLEQPDPYGHAEVTTFTTDGTTINFFAHYAAPSQNDDSMLEYHQYQYDSANIRDSYQGYKDGLR